MGKWWQPIELDRTRIRPVPMPDKPVMPQRWCQCEGKGTCIGCLILTLIQKHYGTGGVMYLLDAIKGRDD